MPVESAEVLTVTFNILTCTPYEYLPRDLYAQLTYIHGFLNLQGHPLCTSPMRVSFFRTVG